MSDFRQRPNPWVAAGRSIDSARPAEEPPMATALEADPVLGAAIAADGPVEPPLTVPSGQVGFGIERVAGCPDIWLFGLHGGCGLSTVQGLLESMDITVGKVSSWPQPADPVGAAPVLLVTRTHGVGLRALQTASKQWASGDVGFVRLLGTVLVADGPQPAKSLRRDITRATSQTPKTWHVKWRENWRSAVDAADRHVGPRESLMVSSILRRLTDVKRSVQPPAELPGEDQPGETDRAAG